MSKMKNRLSLLKKHRWALQPALVITLISLVACGLIYPLVVTGIGQALFTYQANGEIITVNGNAVGSNLIAQNFTLPIFFHPRNDSASGVDPDITVDDAYSQIPRIQNATGISQGALIQIVNENKEGIYWIFGNPYINVLHVNLKLMESYPSVYNEFQFR